MNRIKTDKCPFGDRLQAYWDRRYELFSRFDQGVRLDAEGLYSVKPESAALQIAQRILGSVVLDAFGGVGGSAIAFARAGHQVICVENDRFRLECAAHNAAIYGVSERIEFIHANCLDIFHARGYDSINFDPPRGGPDYSSACAFPLSGFSPDGSTLIQAAERHQSFLAFTVPSNFDYDSITAFSTNYDKVSFESSGKVAFSTFFLDFRKR